MSNLIGIFLPTWKDTNQVRICTTISYMSITLILASTISSLGNTMALIGLLGANTMTFVAPSYLYLKIFNRSIEMCENDAFSEDVEKTTNYTWYIAAVLFVLSCALYPACLSGIIYSLVVSR
mmetsp:Transcript_14266/g.14088  ORF Transcript_14266/g.14088 Transcript_14266/m.14088 type:complete len:122 (+) Transcript_14266:394-759(+)